MDNRPTQFIETDCTIEHEGRSFESGGSFMGRHKKTGKLGGLLYAYEQEGKVGTWRGDRKWPARFCTEWRSNAGDTRQTVYFQIDGVPFIGTYYKSGSDIVRFRQIRAPGWRSYTVGR